MAMRESAMGSPSTDPEIGALHRAFMIALNRLRVTHLIDNAAKRKLGELALNVFVSRDLSHEELTDAEIESVAELARSRLLSVAGGAAFRH